MQVDKKPKSIRVRYKGGDTLRHTGQVPKLADAFVFAGGTPVEVAAVPLAADGRVLPPERGDEAAGWDDGDIAFFQGMARANPETWEIVNEHGLVGELKAVVTKRKGGK